MGRTKIESDTLAPVATCSVIVRFEERGSTHEVEVLAETAYEACVLALHKFGKNRFLRGPGRSSVLELTLMSPRRYTIKVADVLDWLYNKPAKTRDARERKKYLKGVLADDRR